MKKIILLVVLNAFFSLNLISCVSMPSPADEVEKLKKQAQEALKAKENTDKDLEVTKAELKQLRKDAEVFMNAKGAVESLNYRKWCTIKFIILTLVILLWKIAMDIIKLSAFIMLFALILKFVPYIGKVGGVVRALIATPIGCLIGWLWTGADFWYFPAIALVSWLIAIIIWKWAIKKTTIDKKVGTFVYNKLMKKFSPPDNR